jgi:hypothetical protein
MLVYAKDVTQTKSSRSAVNIILASGNFNEGRKYSIFQNLLTPRPKLHQKSRLLCVHNANGRPPEECLGIDMASRQSQRNSMPACQFARFNAVTPRDALSKKHNPTT